MNKLTRARVPNSNYVKWTFTGTLTSEEASNKQKEAGYHPSGYGFYSYEVKDGITTWESSTSCD